MGSADLKDAGGLYDGRLSLPLSKFGGLFPVRVHASKSLPVLVKNSHLPVFVLPPPIFPERSAFSCGFCFGHDLNISMTIRARKYLFGQCFARNEIILYYRVGCNNERQVTGNSSIRPRIPICLAHRACSRPGETPKAHFPHISKGANQPLSLFKIGTSSFETDVGCHRNANEHDHNFGILLSPPAASNYAWRNREYRQACK